MKMPVFLFTLIVSLGAIFSCNKNDVPQEDKIYRFNETLNVDGLERTYTLNLPPNYYESSGFSLVIALHGGGGSGTQFETQSQLTNKANASGFIVVYPDGTGLIRTWNAGNCCGSSVTNHVDDIHFISELIDYLVSHYKINPKKVYATGHSNGGMFCYRLACELPEKIAAIAPNASTMVVTKPCNPVRQVPILHMHSKLDENVPYTGGYGNGISGVYCPPLDSVFNVWSQINNCATPSKITFSNDQYTLTEWLNCDHNAVIHFYLTNDGGHAWPGGLPGSASGDMPSIAINANDLLWDFFQQYQLP
ncbi:MAG: alpha/beta fold hydrolase [Bacteroidetes bacterium]|nr:alpha/beta fold hydrolase [Bacteroidota bacterium]